jgi:epoxyqueuosine reductase
MDVRRRFPWVRSVVCCAVSYQTSAAGRGPGAGEGRGWISRYAWGRDYHKGMAKRLRRACAALKQAGARLVKPKADTSPILERSLHQKAGLGWIGKNTCLIHPDWGSYLFLGEVITDLDLPPDEPGEDRCGSCLACIDACPTGALVSPWELDSRLCISYQTIENRGPIDEDVRALIGDHLFGCDICQEVCPWNSGARVPDLPEFRPRETVRSPGLEELAGLTREGFDERFAGTPVRRPRYEGFMRNLCVAMGNSALPHLRGSLERLSRHESQLVREHALWGLRSLEKGKQPA